MDLTRFTSYEELATRFQWRIPDTYNVAVDMVDRHAQDKGRLALFYEDESGHQEKYSFWEIKNLSNQFANVLRTLGIGKGDRLGIHLSQKPETAISHIAIYKLGGIAVPLSTQYGPDALEQILRDSGAKAIVVDDEHKENIHKVLDKLKALEHVIVVGEAGEREISFWKELRSASRHFEVVATRADDPALIIFTGGTTGPPKGILLAHRCFLGCLVTIETFYDLIFDEDTLFWTPSDWAWGGGWLDSLLPAWWFGRPVLAYTGKFNPEKAFELISRYGVTNAFLVPTALKRMMRVDIRALGADVNLRVIGSAAEPVPDEVVQWAKDTLNVRVNEFYGLTEVGHLVGNCSLWKTKPGSMGRPYPWREVAIIDEQGKRLPPGEVGQIVVKKGDPATFLGYWEKPEETAKRFLGDWILTGDLAVRDEEDYYFFRGRYDDLIGSAGYRIGPAEVEAEMLRHPAVAEAAAVGSPDEARGSIVKAFIRLKGGYQPSDALKKEIQQYVKGNLAAFKYPREIEFVDALPTTAHGKIDRKELRRREEQRKKGNPR